VSWPASPSPSTAAPSSPASARASARSSSAATWPAIGRGRLRSLAHGAVDPARLPAEADGELVHVVGRVRCPTPGLTSILDGKPVVWRRLVFSFNNFRRVVHEAASDFQLVGDGGEPIAIEPGEGRLLAPEGKRVAFDQDHAVATALVELVPGSLSGVIPKSRGKRKWKVRVTEAVLRDGDPIEVLGYKSRTVDPTMAARLERDTPYRASLRGGHALPLLVTPRPA
jgi:hypothetical protein